MPRVIHCGIAIQIATASKETPMARFNAVAEDGEEKILLRAEPNAAHVMTAGRPKKRFMKTKATFPEKPVPKSPPKAVISTRKWIQALPLTIWMVSPVNTPSFSLPSSSGERGGDVATL